MILESLAAFSVVTQALIATTATYLLTAVGTLPVLFFRSAPRRLMDAMMGFAAGVMMAASCWSLLVPAIERGGVVQASVGLLFGGAFLYVAEGPRVGWQRSALLMLAMTLHNFPEAWRWESVSAAAISVQPRRSPSASGCKMFRKDWR